MSVLLWLAGVSWDDIPGTDRRLVEALADEIDVERAERALAAAKSEAEAAAQRRAAVRLQAATNR